MSTPRVHAAEDNWDRHWQDYAEIVEQNPAQRYRRQIIRRLLKRNACQGAARILDIGSGQGDLARDLRTDFPQASITGLEFSAAGIEVSRRKTPDAQFVERNLLEPGDPGALRGWAQYAVCAEVLEHLDDPALFLHYAAEYLAPGCLLIVTVPGGPQSEFDRHIGHRQHFTPDKLRRLLSQAGFEVEAAIAGGFPFFNLYRLAIISRGKRLITDVQTETPSPLASLAMALFRPLFSLNVLSSPWGWQTVAVARWPVK